MDKNVAPAAPRNPAGHAPLRRPGSIRRTSSISTDWPDGRAGNLRMVGRARDAVTPKSGGAPIVVAEDIFTASLQWDRTITAIEAEPARPKLAHLVGARGGGHLRKVLDEVIHEERQNASPLYLVLDDISGVSLISGWAWSQWTTEWRTRPANSGQPTFQPRSMEGVCIGFRPGSSALNFDGTGSRPQNQVPVLDLRNPADPDGFHEFTVQDGVGMRRSRRIDVWVDDLIRIEAGFQDSATNPDGGRVAIHEYLLSATADPKSQTLLSVTPDPRILPFPECPSAVGNVSRLQGSKLQDLRIRVLDELRGTNGCTHLNDALRALAEVPKLVERFKETQPG